MAESLNQVKKGSKMKAYLDNPDLKTATIKAMQDDIKAERLVQGTYWSEEEGNGCFVGCVIKEEGKMHLGFEAKLGIPNELARLADKLFEGLTYEDAKVFSVDFLKAIPVGADLKDTWKKFMVVILIDKDYGVFNKTSNEAVVTSIKNVAEAFKSELSGQEVRWEEIRNTAAIAYTGSAADDTTATAASYAIATLAHDAAVTAASHGNAAYAAAAIVDAKAATAYAAYYAATAAAYAATARDAYYAVATAAAHAHAAYTAVAYAAAATVDVDAPDDAGENHYKWMAEKLVYLLSEAE